MSFAEYLSELMYAGVQYTYIRIFFKNPYTHSFIESFAHP